jgi:hypothetical protein
LWNEAISDALDSVSSPSTVSQYRSFRRLNCIQLHCINIPFLTEKATNARQRPSASLRSDKAVNISAGLAPDLRASGLVVSERIVNIGKLVWEPVLAPITLHQASYLLKT